MRDEMRDDNTEDIFESITIRQAMQTPSDYWGSMSEHMKHWAAKTLLRSFTMLEVFGKYKCMPKSKSKTIKFRRYRYVESEETMVGGFICAESTELAVQSSVGSFLAGKISGYGDCTEFNIEAG